MSNYLPPMALIALGAICSLAGSFWLTRVQALERQRSSDARAVFEKELRLKSDQIAQLNQTIASTITGGDDWCYLMPLRPVIHPNNTSRAPRFDLMLLHEGKYPLYDVTVRIQDSNQAVRGVLDAHGLPKLSDSTISEFQAAMSSGVRVLQLGNLPPNTATAIGPFQFSAGDSQTYLINVLARNGSVSELVRWQRANGDWKLAFRVSRGETVLKEHVDPGFPLPEGKHAPW